MTNEEKAQQIIGCNRANCLECGGSLSVANGCVEFKRIMAMAKWKDHKIKEQDNTILAYNSDIKRLKKVNQTHLIEKKNQAKKIKKIVKEHEDLKKDILTLVNLIPCNEGNESIINDIKNILK